ncbi:MAG: 4Fe-4S binding protein, partial [Candidatus Peregrinibacteria bacterium]|nr:4Fe-4S binding protein [Candidatus Peregrinibacteria bacterium]
KPTCTPISSCPMKPAVRPNSKWQKFLGATFLPILIAGLFFPVIGFIIFLCMIAGFTIAIKQGRKWCDFACPRGSFLDFYLIKISPQKPLPKWFYSYKFRLAFITLLFSFLIFNIVQAWPDINAVGFAFVKTLIITTILSIIFAGIYRARAWCILCPVGTFSGIIGGKKGRLNVDFAKCINCTNCERVCPMGLSPYKDKKTGTLKSPDCIKCKTCIANCPTGALSFKQVKKSKS